MASRVIGVREVRRQLKRLPKALRDEIYEETRTSTREAYAAARARIPVREGIARRWYRWSVSRRTLKGRVGYLTRRAVRQAFHAKFLEWGKSGYAGLFFHQRATDAVEPEYYRRMGATVRTALRRTLG